MQSKTTIFKSFFLLAGNVKHHLELKNLKSLDILNFSVQKNIPKDIIVVVFGYYILEKKLKLNEFYKKTFPDKEMLPLRIRTTEQNNIFSFRDVSPKNVVKYDKLVSLTLKNKFSINSYKGLLNHPESIRLTHYLFSHNDFFKDFDVVIMPVEFEITLWVGLLLKPYNKTFEFDSFDCPVVEKPLINIVQPCQK